MHISERGLHLIKNFEGFRAHTYCCPSGQATIGYGHSGKEARPGRTITREEADAILREDVKWFEAAVNTAGSGKLNQHQFDALVSFAFNVGTGAFNRSGVFIALRSGNLDEIPHVLAKYVRGNAGPLRGLVRRRAAEIELFNTKETL